MIGNNAAMALSDPVEFGSHRAPNRLMFGPLVTNLGDDERRFTDRHVAFYASRAAGGCGVIVTEEASVHAIDWPYERSPLAERCGPTWARIADACHAHGSLVVAALGHTGGQGSSAYSQRELWAPSRVPEVNAREVPKWMEADDVAAVVAGFAAAARTAIEAGCAGVEINAGQHSLIRQFLSGLTNHRDDEWGADRLLFARQVIAAVRSAAGDAIVGLRLSCDELAPWAGITPEQAPSIATALADEGVDYLVVVRGSIFSVEKTRPDFHEPAGFNIELCRSIKAVVTVPVVLQGSIIDPGQAEWALEQGVCDAVEMTRAQLADPGLMAKWRDGTPSSIRPCILCNQTCQVRDARNPIVTCVVEPSTGHEVDDPTWYSPSTRPRDVVVVGAGPAGMETARVAAIRGHRVRVVEREPRVGGVAAGGPGTAFVGWQRAELDRLGVEVSTGVEVMGDDALPPGEVVVQATGAQAGGRSYDVDPGAVAVHIVEIQRGGAVPDGTVALFDPIGGPIAIALAEQLGDRAVLITQDNIAGNELSRTGDLAPANSRLQQRGVRIERRSLLRRVGVGWVELEDRFSGERRRLECDALIDCGFRLPSAHLTQAHLHAGDCVAPRTIYEAVLEGRRAALAVDHAHQRLSG